MVNVVHFNAYYLSSSLYTHLYEALFTKGIARQDVIAPAYRMPATAVARRDGHTVHCVRLFQPYHRLLFPLKVQRYVKYCATLHRQTLLRADLIHAHTLFTDGAPAAYLARVYRKPLVVAVRTSDINLFYRRLPFLRPYAWNTLRSAAAVITLSETHRCRLLECLPRRVATAISSRITVIPNGIPDVFHDSKAVVPPLRVRDGNSGRLNLLYVGNSTRNKNLATLIGAAKLIHEDGQLRELRIIGGLSHVPPCAPAAVAGQSPNIRFFSRMSSEELIPQYRWADVFAMPSIYETFGLVYAEALSQGTPVVCTKGEGFSSWIRDEITGIAVTRPKNAIEVANAILRIAAKGNPATCVADAARFRWALIAQNYVALYSSVREHPT